MPRACSQRSFPRATLSVSASLSRALRPTRMGAPPCAMKRGKGRGGASLAAPARGGGGGAPPARGGRRPPPFHPGQLRRILGGLGAREDRLGAREVASHLGLAGGDSRRG